MTSYTYIDFQKTINDYKIHPQEVRDFLWCLVFDESYQSTRYEDQKLHDLVVEFYIFITDGDLSTQGRDFGFSKIEEFEYSVCRMITNTETAEA
jgi:hypothetical protein